MSYRTYFLTIFLLLALLAACAAPAADDSITAPPDATASGLEATKMVVDVSGAQVEVPVQPQRIAVAWDRGITELVAAAELPLIAAASTHEFAPFLVEALNDLEGVVDLGSHREVNIEALALAEPDLIFIQDVTSHGDPQLLENAQQIAPTVQLDASKGLREFIADFGAIMGDETAAMLNAQVDAAVAQMAAAVHDPGSVIVSNGMILPDSIRLYKDNSNLASQLMAEAGYARPASQMSGSDQIINDGTELSFEELEQLDGDVLFLGAIGTDEELSPITSSALWETLDVVQNDAVIDTDWRYWNVGGPLAAQHIADDFVRGLQSVGLAAAAAAADERCDEGFRLFAHYGGETCVPENPQRIVTTQDQNGLLPLLELGVKPVGSAGQLLDDGTGRFRRVQGYDTTGIEFVGAYWGEANVESIALLQPDLIVSHEFAADFYDLHSQVAPTVMIQIFDRPLDEVLMDFADLVGRTERAEELRADYTARIEGLLDALGDRKETMSISVITAGNNPGEFYRADQGQAVGTVMADLDLLRPAAQQDAVEEREYLSIESLPEHDADVVLVLNFSGEDQDPNFESFVNSPIFSSLAAAQAGQVYIIDGTQTVGAAWGKMNTFIDELERILLDPELDVDVVQE